MTVTVSLCILTPQGQGGKGAWAVQATASLLQDVQARASGCPAGREWLCRPWEDSTAWQDRACADGLAPQIDASPVVKVGFILYWVNYWW